MLDFNKLDHGILKPDVKLEPVAGICEVAKMNFEIGVFMKNIDLPLNMSNHSMMDWADRDQIEKMLYNLCSNALEYASSENENHVQNDYLFAKPSPHMDGTFATNHCTEMPYVFNNIWLGRFMVGASKSSYKLADFMSDVWVSFAKDGVPDTKKFKWEEYNPETKPVVVFNDKTTTVYQSDTEFWNGMKEYKRDTWKFRQPMF